VGGGGSGGGGRGSPLAGLPPLGDLRELLKYRLAMMVKAAGAAAGQAAAAQQHEPAGARPAGAGAVTAV
jgi:hypothetical protein